LDVTVRAMSIRSFDAVVVQALGAKTVSDALRVWQAVLELVDPLAMNVDRAAHAAVVRLVGVMPADLASILLVEAVCAWPLLLEHLNVRMPRRRDDFSRVPRDNRDVDYAGLPVVLAGDWRKALSWLSGRIGAAQPAPEKE
jgi:hypothetical protein